MITAAIAATVASMVFLGVWNYFSSCMKPRAMTRRLRKRAQTI